MSHNSPERQSASPKTVWSQLNGGRAGDDFTADVNLDLPFWRFVLLAVICGGGFFGLLLLGAGGAQQIRLIGWILEGLVIAMCLVPPLLWRWLRRTRPVVLSLGGLVVLWCAALLFL